MRSGIELLVHGYFFQKQTAGSQYIRSGTGFAVARCAHGLATGESEAASIRQSRRSRVHTGADPHQIAGETTIIERVSTHLRRRAGKTRLPFC